jgi:NADH-quinone oxidoreductase subunit A
MTEYIGIIVAFVIAGGFAGLNIVLAQLLGLAIKFYLTAILFILFDVELVFLYPWAVVYRTLGAMGLTQMVIFLGVLMVGFFYAWDNGALDWQ